MLVKSSMFYPLVLVALVASVSGAPSGGSGRVSGGSLAVEGEFPFIVSISENDAHICGGFIYNDRWIVTAASCVDERNTTDLKVKVGALVLINPNPGEQILKLKDDPLLYPEYNPVTKIHDIALLTLERPIVFGTTAQPIRYDETDLDANSPADSTISGWGAVEDEGLASTRLRFGLIDNIAADCKGYGVDEYVKNYMICASGETASPCEFDEGSPLTQVVLYGAEPEEIVVGIMSKNLGCSTSPLVPSIYTRLSAYYSWLLQNAGQQPTDLIRRRPSN